MLGTTLFMATMAWRQELENEQGTICVKKNKKTNILRFVSSNLILGLTAYTAIITRVSVSL